MFTQPCLLSNPVDSSPYTLGLLPKIEARERHAKRRYATQMSASRPPAMTPFPVDVRDLETRAPAAPRARRPSR